MYGKGEHSATFQLRVFIMLLRTENLVRAFLSNVIEGGFTPFRPTGTQQNAPLALTYQPEHKIQVGRYNFATERLELSPAVRGVVALRGFNAGKMADVLCSLKFDIEGINGINAITVADNKIVSDCYAPLDAVYQAAATLVREAVKAEKSDPVPVPEQFRDKKGVVRTRDRKPTRPAALVAPYGKQ